jgi:signal transduction histidine kinase
LQDLALAIFSLDANVERYLVIGGLELQESILQDFRNIEDTLGSINKNANPQTRPILKEIEETIVELETEITDLMESPPSASREMNEKIVAIVSRIKSAERLHQELSAVTLAQLQDTVLKQKSILSSVSAQFLVLSGLVSLIVVAASLLVTRSIAVPLSNLTATAARIAAGHLELEAPVEREDEVGALAGAFNQMTTQLRDLIESLEQHVAERTAKLETANTELSQYAYIVSHDLRAPLRAVRNYADFIREDLEGTLDGEQKTYLDGLGRAVHEAEELIEDLLKLSRLDRHNVQMETVDLGLFLRELIASLDLPAEVETVMGDGWPTLEVEPTLLRQIFQNLIDNAIKFNDSPRKRVELDWRPAEEGYELFVRDNGIGIKPRYQAQIFRMFERLHTWEEYEGTGIGLAIVKKAAGKLGSSVRLESQPGQGSTFFVTLPKTSPLGKE